MLVLSQLCHQWSTLSHFLRLQARDSRNKIEYRDRLNERLDSGLQKNEIVFDPYNATQIRAILEHREDAFVDGALEDGVISKVAAIAAQEHGDARKTVDTLYEAGRLAEKAGETTVTEDQVDDAVQQAEINRFEQLISGTTPHVKHLLRTLALLTADAEGQQAFRHTRCMRRIVHS